MFATFQGFHRSFDNVSWGFKIGLPDAEIDDVPSFGCQLIGTSENSKGIFVAQIGEIGDGM